MTSIQIASMQYTIVTIRLSILLLLVPTSASLYAQELSSDWEASALVQRASTILGEISESEQRIITDMIEQALAPEGHTDAEGHTDSSSIKASLSAKYIAWLCTDKLVTELITHRGLNIANLTITGGIDLRYSRIDFPVRFDRCVFDSPILIDNARLQELVLDQSEVHGLSGDETFINGSLRIRNSTVAAEGVRLTHARIKGHLDLRGTKLNVSSPDQQLRTYSLYCPFLKVDGSVLLSGGFITDAEICLSDAHVGGQLICDGAELKTTSSVALTADRIQIVRGLSLSEGFTASGQVRFQSAIIAGALRCDQAQIASQEGPALLFDAAKLGRNGMQFKNTTLTGQFRAAGLTVDGSLRFIACNVNNSSGAALHLERAVVSGNLSVSRKSKFVGEIRLVQASIHGQVALHGDIAAQAGPAIVGDSLSVGESLFLTEATFCGEVRLLGATIANSIELSDLNLESQSKNSLTISLAKIGHSFSMRKCVCKGGIRASNMSIGEDLEIGECSWTTDEEHPATIDASQSKITGRVALYNLKLQGSVQFKGVKIDEGLKVNKCSFISEKKTAFSLFRADIGGNVAFENTSIVGQAFFRELQVHGNLYFLSSSMQAKSEKSGVLNLSHSAIDGDLGFMDNSAFLGSIDVSDSQVGGTVGAFDTTFEADNPLLLDRISVTGGIHIKSHCIGEVSLNRANVCGELRIASATLDNSRSTALSVDNATLGSLVVGANSKINGRTVGRFAQIDGLLHLNQVTCLNQGRIAVDFSYLRARNVQVAEKFACEGSFSLLSAQIEANVNFHGARLSRPGGQSLNCDAIVVAGHVFLRNGFSSEGEVQFHGAQIDGNLECIGASFTNPDGDAFDGDGISIGRNCMFRDGCEIDGNVRMTNAHVAKSFQWLGMPASGNTSLDLRHATVGILRDQRLCWPNLGELELHGLVYEIFDNRLETPRDATSRVEWLKRQGSFSQQSYLQLAKVLTASGDSNGAADVLIALEHERVQHAEIHWLTEWVWYQTLGRLIGYGHRPWRAVYLGVACMGIGALVFTYASKTGTMIPSERDAIKLSSNGLEYDELYGCFNAIVYSIDAFTPVIDFGQAKAWTPGPSLGASFTMGKVVLPTGRLVQAYLWLHIAAGWTLSTLLVVAFTKLVLT